MRTVGFLVFAVGVMVAISAGAKLPPAAYSTEDAPAASDSRFPDTLLEFAGGVAIAGVGLTLWWMDVLKERRAIREGTSTVASDPLQMLKEMQQPLRELAGSLDSIEISEIPARIEAMMEQHIEPFVAARTMLIDRLGMGKASEVLVPCAYAERMLNRAWSAAADGNLAEARTSCQDGVTAFEDAARIGGVAAD